MTPVGDVVPRVLADLGLGGPILRIAERWEEIVGPEIARQCRPVVLRGRVLEAAVTSSVWRHEIELRRRDFLAALALALGDEAPTDLRLRLG
jgi:predicted nucleic acid-binding Zn ribbon protein